MAGIKVFGERNTGTRAIIRMINAVDGVQVVRGSAQNPAILEECTAALEDIEANERGVWKRVYREAVKDVRQENLGPLGAWKHAAPRYTEAYESEDVRVIFMVRNPYSWALSLFRHPYHMLAERPASLTAFLTRRWLTLRRDAVDTPVLDSPMRLWTLKLAAYAAFRDAGETGRSAVIRFEDFVAAPDKALSRTLEGFGLRTGPIAAIPAPTKPGGKAGVDRRQYYATEAWRKELSTTDVALINGMVDWDIAARFGYQRMCPSEVSARTAQRLQLVR